MIGMQFIREYFNRIVSEIEMQNFRVMIMRIQEKMENEVTNYIK